MSSLIVGIERDQLDQVGLPGRLGVARRAILRDRRGGEQNGERGDGEGAHAGDCNGV